MTRVLVPLADGCEEMEAVIIIDTLRRAGWEVVAAGLTGVEITASRGVGLRADATWADVDPLSFDVIALPGGTGGMEALRRDTRVLAALRDLHAAGRIVAAICAAPLVLQEAGLLDGKRATCHPAVADELTCTPRRDERVVTDGNIVTSQGPGTAFEFALALIAQVDGAAAAARVKAGLVL